MTPIKPRDEGLDALDLTVADQVFRDLANPVLLKWGHALIARIRELQEMLEEADAAGFLMSNALGRVKALHRPWGIYDECGHDHGPADDEDTPPPGLHDIPDVGRVCDAGLLYTICYECDTDEGECREDSEAGEYPCATIKALED